MMLSDFSGLDHAVAARTFRDDVFYRLNFFPYTSRHCASAHPRRARERQLADPRQGGAAERLRLKPSTLESRMAKVGITRPTAG
jgi:transcriptional regulator with GAF, ATPase, and Fis domain